VPLIGAGLVFGGVLLTTPPGVRALSDVLLGGSRGPNADAAAFALGAAASLALVALIVIATITAGIEFVIKRSR
jgi:hypothetical protein